MWYRPGSLSVLVSNSYRQAYRAISPSCLRLVPSKLRPKRSKPAAELLFPSALRLSLRRAHAAARGPPGSGISTGNLTFKRDFNTVLTIQQGFQKGPSNSQAGVHHGVAQQLELRLALPRSIRAPRLRCTATPQLRARELGWRENCTTSTLVVAWVPLSTKAWCW
jgi:hypothetical protein